MSISDSPTFKHKSDSALTLNAYVHSEPNVTERLHQEERTSVEKYQAIAASTITAFEKAFGGTGSACR
jgi:hypothetical protein